MLWHGTWIACYAVVCYDRHIVFTRQCLNHLSFSPSVKPPIPFSIRFLVVLQPIFRIFRLKNPSCHGMTLDGNMVVVVVERMGQDINHWTKVPPSTLSHKILNIYCLHKHKRDRAPKRGVEKRIHIPLGVISSFRGNSFSSSNNSVSFFHYKEESFSNLSNTKVFNQ